MADYAERTPLPDHDKCAACGHVLSLIHILTAQEVYRTPGIVFACRNDNGPRC